MLIIGVIMGGIPWALWGSFIKSRYSFWGYVGVAVQSVGFGIVLSVALS